MNVKWNIRLIYIYTFMIGTVFVLPIIIPYYRDSIGLSYRDFLIGEAVFAAVIILMEVPSGWMSDVWSRKKTLIIGCGFAFIGYGIMTQANDLYTAILGQAIIGIGVACNSGTVTSLLYDSLAMKGREDLYQKLEGKRHGISLYAVAIGSVIGGIVYQYDVKLPLYLDMATIAIAMLCACLITEPERVKRAAETHPLRDMLITMKYALHGHKEIAGIILVSTILFCSTKMYMWSQQPYMDYIGIPVDYFGYIIASGFILSGVAGHFGHHIKHSFSNRQVIGGLVVYMVLATAFAIMFPVAPAIIFVLAIAPVWGFGFPFVQAAINKHADPARRATILSTLGLLISLSFIPTSLLLGWISDEFSILYGLGYLAFQLAMLSVGGLWLWSANTKKKN